MTNLGDSASARPLEQGQWRLPHPTVTLEAGRGRTQVAGSGGVRVREGATEFLCGPRSWRDGHQARLLEPCRAVIAHGHDGRAGLRGLGEPRKARNLVGDPPAAAIRLSHGLHRRSPFRIVGPAWGTDPPTHSCYRLPRHAHAAPGGHGLPMPRPI